MAMILLLSSMSGASFAGGADARGAAAAEALYREGKQLLVEGRAQLACGKLETSHTLEPAIGTLLLLGHCYEQVGKTASAWAPFRSAESLARVSGQLDRSELARVRAESLEPRLSRLQIVQPGAEDVRSWSIREDDRELAAGVLGAAIPVDPGPRRLAVSAPGYEGWSAQVTVPPGPGTTVIQIPALVPQRRALAAPVLAAPVLPAPMLPAPEGHLRSLADDRRAPNDEHDATLRTLSYVGLGVGAAALAVGATYAVLAQQRYDASLAACRTQTSCSPRGVVLRESAENRARVATVATISGAILSTSGLVGWLLARRESADEPRAAVSVGAAVSALGVGVEARGTF